MKDIALIPTTIASRRRIVVLTQSAEPTLVLSVSGPNELEMVAYDVPAVAKAEIVDTNGAGDVFAGGLVAALILGKNIGEAVAIGNKMGGMCIRQVRQVSSHFRNYPCSNNCSCHVGVRSAPNCPGRK